MKTLAGPEVKKCRRWRSLRLWLTDVRHSYEAPAQTLGSCRAEHATANQFLAALRVRMLSLGGFEGLTKELTCKP